MKALFFTALVLVATTSQSASNSFSCAVKNQSLLNDDGTFSLKALAKDSIYFEQRFLVDRASGRVTGTFFHNNDAEQITIVDNGSNPENAFHIFWTGRKVVAAPFLYLYIESFIKPKSPFVWIRGGESFSGLCQ